MHERMVEYRCKCVCAMYSLYTCVRLLDVRVEIHTDGIARNTEENIIYYICEE